MKSTRRHRTQGQALLEFELVLPVLLVIVYASLGALFLPFLAITLLILLNSERVDPEFRNRLVSNVVLAVSVIPFIVVGVQEVLGSL